MNRFYFYWRPKGPREMFVDLISLSFYTFMESLPQRGFTPLWIPLDSDPNSNSGPIGRAIKSFFEYIKLIHKDGNVNNFEKIRFKIQWNFVSQ